MAKARFHNEWFRPVSLKGRKSCPTCRRQLQAGSIWSWGEYRRAQWYTVKYFCQQCFAEEVQKPLLAHTNGCGCAVLLCGRDGPLPEWLTLLP
jgi:hypothetical protein